MQALPKILLLLLAVQLPLISVAETSTSYSWVVIQSTENSQGSLDYPIDPSNLFDIHGQAEKSAEIIDSIPQLQSTTEQKYESFGSSAPETVIERWLKFYIRFGNLIEPGLTTLKLIFPFHFFL